MAWRTLLTALLSLSAVAASEKPAVKRFSALTAPLPLTQGEVTNTFHRLAIPKGPIAVYRFEAEVVEKDANGDYVSVPTFDAYLHHHVVGSTHEKYADEAEKWAPMKPVNFSRSVGFGAGTECRGTPQEFYFPYAFMTVEGEDEWVANVHVINTRKMSPTNAHKCLECPCTTEDVITADAVNGIQFTHSACNAQLRFENNTVCSPRTYHGGLRCCEDSEFCLEKEQLDASVATSTYYLRYTIEFADIVPANRPLYLAGCCDASGDLEHKGNVEYDVPLCDPETHPGCVHTLSTRQRLDMGPNSIYTLHRNDVGHYEDREIELIYAVGHQHRGGLGIQMYNDATGDLLCSSVPTYGTGDVAGNENHYVVGMSTCTFDPPVRMRASDIVRIVALYNNTEAHTGVMSLMYLALSDVVDSTGTTAAMAVDGKASYFGGLFTVSPVVVVAAMGALALLAVFTAIRIKKRAGYTPLSPPIGSSK